MLVAVIILGVLFILASWIAVVQYIRCTKLENIANTVVANMQTISDLISDTSDTLNNEQLNMAFSNDDEVGDFFKEIKNIQEILNKFIIQNGKKSSVEQQ